MRLIYKVIQYCNSDAAVPFGSREEFMKLQDDAQKRELAMLALRFLEEVKHSSPR